ncbi:unnamed protein product [Somion occarium]|uniref:Uncharacterized protein n=1 Tax=Somion occarium TaxID=3059160 RepID=A0ABP1DMR8_9APHY
MAPPYVVEIAQITVTDAYKADPNIVQEAVEFLKNANESSMAWAFKIRPSGGCLSNGKRLSTIKISNDKELYPILRQRIRKFSSGVKLFHVDFIESPHIAFEAPYAELALWTLKSGHTTKEKKEHALELLKGVVTTLNGLPSDSGVFKGTVGPIVEEAENGVALTLGWTSPDATKKALETLPEAQVIIDELKEIADLRLVHVPLTSAK